LPFMADNSVDSIVCDPPYELGFMGKSWDSSGIAYSVDLWRECLRVLKPGGHLLAFGGSRTWHRVAVAIEDAGFDLRDSIAWLYGSGFPKSHDVSKAIDKAAGAEREKVKHLPRAVTSGTMMGSSESRPWIEKSRQQGFYEADGNVPVTPEAEQWAGWGTALKPAFEPVVVARKPLVGTVAENVLAWGVGGLNIDASRISYESQNDFETVKKGVEGGFRSSQQGTTFMASAGADRTVSATGRWPANIILDEYTAGLLDEQSGISTSLSHKRPHSTKWGFGVNADNAKEYDYETGGAGYGDTGGASRFFYVAKASKRDRNEGLEELESKATLIGAAGHKINPTTGKEVVDIPRQNFHPTVKPTDLMRYLIKLVTPAGGIVLDPFTGSGSTGKAALLDGYQFVGIELTADYLPIIEGRLRWAEQEHRDQVARLEAEEKETLF
jgi:DNA modification methylase